MAYSALTVRSALATLAVLVTASCYGSGGGSDGDGSGGSAGQSSGGKGGKGGSGSGATGGSEGGDGSGGTLATGGQAQGGTAGTGGALDDFTIQTGTPLASDDFPHAYAVAACARKAECCELSGNTLSDTCVADLEAHVQTNIHDIMIAAGSEFDAAIAGDCIATLTVYPCGNDANIRDIVSDYFGDEDAIFPDFGVDEEGTELCGAYGRGTTAAEGSCTLGRECAASEGMSAYCNLGVCTEYMDGDTPTGTECEKTPDCSAPDGCRDGYCGPKSDEGGPCYENLDCVEGYHCESQLHTCGPLVAESGVCGEDTDCQPGLQCSSVFSGTCVVPGGLGDECAEHSGCAWDLWCNGDPSVGGSGVGTCESDLAFGEPCVDGDQCVGDECDHDLCGGDVECVSIN
jgi:hypothetical protein